MNSAPGLAGRRVVNTRSTDQAAELDGLLQQRSAVSLPYPCIDIVPLEDAASLERAVTRLAAGAFDWLVLTSVNAARAVAKARERIAAGDAAGEAAAVKARVAAVGPGTAGAVRTLLGLKVDLESPVHTGEALGRELAAENPGTVLLPLGDLAGDGLAEWLRAAGADVTVVTAYRTVPGSGGVDLPGLLRRGEVDAVAFTSPSTVDNLALRLAQEGGDWGLLNRVCVACIGPVTARAAAARGLQVQAEPQDHTLMGLVDALDAFFGGAGTGSTRKGDS